MNSDFMLSQLRAACLAAIAFAAGKGWFSPADATFAVAMVTTLGPILAPFLISAYANFGVKKVPNDSIAISNTGIENPSKGDTVAVTGKIVGALFTAFLIFGSQHAQAADVLPVKAPTQSALFTGFPYTGSGLYWGLNSIGGGGSVKASGAGVNPNSVTSNEIGIGLTVGYSKANADGSIFYAFEAMFDWQNFNGNSPGLSFDGPASFEQRVKIGAPLANFLSMLPNNPFGNLSIPPFPALPNGATATNIHPYLMVGLHEDDVSLNFGLSANRAWRIAPSLGIGAMGQLTNGIAVDVWAETVFPQSAVCTDGVACGSIAQQYKVGMAILY